MKTALIIIVVIVSLIWGGWLVAIPSELIVNKIEPKMVSGEFKGKFEGFNKGWFYNFNIDALDIYKGDDVIFSVFDIHGELDLSSLLSLTPALDIQGTLAGGTFISRVSSDGKSFGVTFKLSDARLEHTGLFALTGYRGKGALKAEGAISNGTGEVRFQVDEASFAPVEVMGMPIPVDMVKAVRGIAKLKGNDIIIPSVAFEGKGFHARISGDIKKEIANLSVELTAMDSAIPDVMLSAVLGKYRKDKGHYVIPIRTRLSLNALAGGRK
jgi:type II secretion system protein N